jgi:hypothetical protein
MFAIRSVCGKSKGKYYAGFDDAILGPKFTDSVGEAEKVSGKDAAGIVMAGIDYCYYLIPEFVGDVDRKEQDDFASTLVNGMFSSQASSMSKVIATVIRMSPDDAIHEQPDADKVTTSGHLSIYEWMLRVIVARRGSIKL